MSAVLPQLNVAMESLVERVGHNLVRVHNGKGGAGAGTIWHPDGLILTNAHVATPGPLQVTLPEGSTVRAEIMAYNMGQDLAALTVDATDLPTIELGESRLLQPGQWVLALGHLWGVIGAATAGVVIGIGTPEWDRSPIPGGDWIAVGLQLRPGYSGGPLVDIQGRLVGINTMMTGPGLGVAVPVHAAKAFLKNALGSGPMIR